MIQNSISDKCHTINTVNFSYYHIQCHCINILNMSCINLWSFKCFITIEVLHICWNIFSHAHVTLFLPVCFCGCCFLYASSPSYKTWVFLFLHAPFKVRWKFVSKMCVWCIFLSIITYVKYFSKYYDS